ncbi:hypothetical protein BH09BAC2_BH09BAC2_20260 [soil metagenome]
MNKFLKLKHLAFVLFAVCAIMACSSPKMVEYRDYHNFKIINAGFTTSTIALDLEYYNPNNFGMQLSKIDLDVFINDKMLGHTTLDTLIQIPRRNTFLLPLAVNVDMQQVFSNLLNTLVGKEVTVKATGKLKVGKSNVFMSMPVNYEGKHTFTLF